MAERNMIDRKEKENKNWINIRWMKVNQGKSKRYGNDT